MTARDQRALVLGGALIVAAVLVLRLAPMAVDRAAAAREELEARAGLLERMRAQVTDAARLQDSAAAVRRRVAELVGELLPPGSEAEAATSLGALISMAAERARVRVSSTEPVPDAARAGAARRVSVRATLESDTAGLLAVLGALARGQAAVAVSELRVAADPPPTPAGPELVHTELTVHGWYLPRGGTR